MPETILRIPPEFNAFGSTLGYWCQYCESHVLEGHYEHCIVVRRAMEIYGSARVHEQIIVREWNNALSVRERRRKNG